MICGLFDLLEQRKTKWKKILNYCILTRNNEYVDDSNTKLLEERKIDIFKAIQSYKYVQDLRDKYNLNCEIFNMYFIIMHV